jgi:hypothetical protein
VLIDRKHTGWIVFTAAAAALATAAYVLDAPRHLSGPGGSTAVGITLGSIALAIMLFCAALGLKRRVPHWRLGRAQTWLRGHIWLGLLVVVLVALHAAFRVGGPLTLALWVLLLAVTVSGVVGLILQQVLPTALTRSVRGETVAQQIDRELAGLPALAEDVLFSFDGGADPEVRAKMKVQPPPWLSGESDAPQAVIQKKVLDLRDKRVVNAKGRDSLDRFNPFFSEGRQPLREFHARHVAGYLAGGNGAMATQTTARLTFDELRRSVAPAVHPGIDAIESICARRRELLTQRRLQRTLMAWLLFHVPLSWALIVLTIVHAVVALRYGS